MFVLDVLSQSSQANKNLSQDINLDSSIVDLVSISPVSEKSLSAYLSNSVASPDPSPPKEQKKDDSLVDHGNVIEAVSENPAVVHKKIFQKEEDVNNALNNHDSASKEKTQDQDQSNENLPKQDIGKPPIFISTSKPVSRSGSILHHMQKRAGSFKNAQTSKLSSLASSMKSCIIADEFKLLEGNEDKAELLGENSQILLIAKNLEALNKLFPQFSDKVDSSKPIRMNYAHLCTVQSAQTSERPEIFNDESMPLLFNLIKNSDETFDFEVFGKVDNKNGDVSLLAEPLVTKEKYLKGYVVPLRISKFSKIERFFMLENDIDNLPDLEDSVNNTIFSKFILKDESYLAYLHKTENEDECIDWTIWVSKSLQGHELNDDAFEY